MMKRTRVNSDMPETAAPRIFMLDRLLAKAAERDAAKAETKEQPDTSPLSITPTMIISEMTRWDEAEAERLVKDIVYAFNHRYRRELMVVDADSTEPTPAPLSLPAPALAPSTAPHDPSTGGGKRGSRGPKAPFNAKIIEAFDITKLNGYAFQGQQWRTYEQSRENDPEGTMYVIWWKDFSKPAMEQAQYIVGKRFRGGTMSFMIGANEYHLEGVVAVGVTHSIDARVTRGSESFRRAWSYIASLNLPS
jgi:hypothetical protein